ncbi:MAG: D-alanyl-D-alanine carboxypeptidase family protein [Clostridia bacterium]
MKKLSKFVSSLLVIIVISNNYIFGTSYIYEKKESYINKESSISTVANPSFTFESYSQVLMEPSTGRILYANNENEKMLPASVTKVMTLLLIMEQIDSGVLDYADTVTCSKNASKMGGSQIWFEEGETLTIDEALKAICVVSANDVTVAMAELIGGNEENFVIAMNAKARELGMENTHFMNCHGIDEEGHYTCAKDVAIMARELITKHPNILNYTSIWMDTLRDGKTELTSTNKLIRFYDGATGLKTGYTSSALYNLVATATRKDTTFISVVMKAPSSDVRLAETKTLLDYGFATYETKKICSSNTILEEIDINKNIDKKLETRLEDDIYNLVEKGKNIETEQIITYNDNLVAPINANDIIGNVEIIDKTTNEIIGKTNIVANNNVDRSRITDYLKFIFSKFLLKA